MSSNNGHSRNGYTSEKRDIAISVRGLSKRYLVAKNPDDNKKERTKAGSESLMHRLQNPFARPSVREFWALRNVSFDVERGEVVGIVGRNGAGKSTLFKLLSRITRPTEGEVHIRGKLGSLLEVGTGFHPELTGRENIYLNGAILGMRRSEIQKLFDSIVEFSEISQFLDTPVKRYSSGMYVRLAFAVAAHLSPDILILDEVLAVGDSQFQKKCMNRISEIARTGDRTVLFVSHNMGAVGTLCTSAVYLKQGQLQAVGATRTIIDKYIRDNLPGVEGGDLIDDEEEGYYFTAESRQVAIACGDPIRFSFQIRCPREISNATAGMVLTNMQNIAVLGASSKFQGVSGSGTSRVWHFDCDFGRLPLNSGVYGFKIYLGNREGDYARFTGAIELLVEDGDPFGWGGRVPAGWGMFYWTPQWQITPQESLPVETFLKTEQPAQR